MSSGWSCRTLHQQSQNAPCTSSGHQGVLRFKEWRISSRRGSGTCIQGGKKLVETTLEPGDQEHTWTLDLDFRLKPLPYYLLGPSVDLSVEWDDSSCHIG